MISAPRRKVFVDLAPLAADGSNGGSRPTVLALLDGLLERGELELHLLVKPGAAGVLGDLARRGAALHLLGRDIAEPRRLLRMRRRLVSAPDGASLRRRGASLLLSPLGTAAFHERGLPHVAVAYDFQELALPGYFAGRERRRRSEFRATLRRATRVVAISEATRRMGIERVRLPAERVVTIPPVVPERPRLTEQELRERLAALSLAPGGYAFYPANFWPHKNHARLLAALARAGGVTLVLCGALDEARVRLRAEAVFAGLGNSVRVLEYLPDADVTALLQGARLLVFPSLFEGFGIPVLEAFRLGTPVACSALPALTELAGDAARTFDPSDAGAIAAALAELWASEALRRELVTRGAARAPRFDAAVAVRAYAGLLDSVAGVTPVEA